MASENMREQLAQLSGRRVTDAELEAFWDACEPVRRGELSGLWRGRGLDNGHRLGGLLGKVGWYGKRFDAVDDVKPLMCRDAAGNLFSDVDLGKGEASLWDVEFRGRVHATMVYDGQAVLDHFARVDDDTLLGVMNGKAELVLDGGSHYWFVLERDR
ncbi:MAG TPA: DUF4334 domain-containing protein [Aeromicrobium sp.]|nr:DUF4334 domain-containing protein [Aeromicrobium sp.]